jgi:hypothetical protein
MISFSTLLSSSQRDKVTQAAESYSSLQILSEKANFFSNTAPFYVSKLKFEIGKRIADEDEDH